MNNDIKLRAHPAPDYSGLQKIHSQSDSKPHPLTHFFQKIISCIKEHLRSSHLYSSSREHNRTIMIQENLLTAGENRGSYNSTQKNIFLKHMGRKINPTPEFQNVQQSLSNLKTLDDHIISSFFLGRTHLAKALHSDVKKLKNEEGLWLDLTSRPGGHAMKGQIFKTNEGQFLFRMCNTGAGIDVYPKWHPSQFHQHKKYYQTVVEWGPFENADCFSVKFFEEILNATLDGAQPEGAQKIDFEQQEGAYGESLKPIAAIYQTLEKNLHQPKKIPIGESLDRHWSTSQEGPSCTPNSIWGLLRVNLSPEEYAGFRTEVQVKNLENLYKKIVSGADRTNYNYALAKEQVDRLISDYELSGKVAPPLFKKIKNNIMEKAPKKIKVHITNPPAPLNAENSTVELKMARLKPLPGPLKAHIVYENVTNEDEASISTLKLERNSEEELTGTNTLAFALYQAVLSGQEEAIANSLNAFTEWTKEIDQLSSTEVDRKKLAQLIEMFCYLSHDMRIIDGTMESRPKQLAMANVAKTLLTLYYATGSKGIKEPNPYHGNNKIIKNDDIWIYEMVEEQMEQASTFSKLTSKYKYPDNSNEWNASDQALRPYDMLPNWNSWKTRMNLDAAIASEQNKNRNNDDRSSLIPQSKKINYHLKADYQGPFSYGYAANYGPDGIPNGKDYSTITLRKPPIWDQKPYEEKKPGKTEIYNFYKILATQKPINEVIDCVNEINQVQYDSCGEDFILEIAKQLRIYTQEMRHKDLSPEALLRQQTSVKMAEKLLKKLISKGPNANATTLLKEVQNELIHYEIVNPKQYFSFRNTDPKYKSGLDAKKLLKLFD